MKGQGAFSTASRIEFVIDKDKNKILAVQDAQNARISLWDRVSRTERSEPFNGDLAGLNSSESTLLYRDANERVIVLDLASDDLSRFDTMRTFLCNILSGRELNEDEWDQFFPDEEKYTICSNP